MKTKTRVILATFAAFILLAAAIGAGLNAVFTVTYVRAEFSTCSHAGERDAATLRADLDKEFLGESTTFLDPEEVRSVAAAYPYFRVTAVEKQFPSALRVSLEERRETFALPTAEGFAILDEDGGLLEYKAENSCRDGGANILLDGFSLTVEEGTLTGDYAEAVLCVMHEVAALLPAPRVNTLSIRLLDATLVDFGLDRFRLTMHEGIVIDIVNPTSLPAEKAKSVISAYIALDDNARTYGKLSVTQAAGTGELLPPDHSATVAD